MPSKRENIRKKIVSIYNENKQLSYAEVARRSKVSRQTDRNVIFKFHKDLSIKHKKVGWPSGFRNSQIDKKVKAFWKQNPNISIRDIARKLNILKSMVERVKKKENLRTFKVKKAPNKNEKGTKTARIRARKLLRHKLNNFKGCVLMDDETYCKADYAELPGQGFYVTNKRGNVPNKFKFKKISKCMIWQAICTCRRTSQAVIVNRTMHSQFYVSQCLKKYLLPLYKIHKIPPLF